MRKETCNDCQALDVFSEPQEIGVKKYRCIRNPIKTIPIQTQQGVQFISIYPPTNPTMPACFEMIPIDEDEDESETVLFG